MKQLLRGINPWLPVLVFVTAFHIERGSYGDAVIFGTGALLIIADWKKLIPGRGRMPERIRLNWMLVTAVVVIGFAVLFFSDRGGWQDIVLLLLLAPVAMFLIYYRDHGPKPSLTRVMNRTKWVWMILALCMAVVELFSYILAEVYQDDSKFPTVSVLVNPVLESAWGRGIFLVLWMLIGVGVLHATYKRRRDDFNH